MTWRATTTTVCGFLALAAGCTSVPVERTVPTPQVQQVQREYDYTLAKRVHRLHVNATVELHDGLCSGPGQFEARLDGNVVHSQSIFVAYVATDQCAATMPSRTLHFITASVGSDAQLLRSLAKRIIASDHCMRDAGTATPPSDVVCAAIMQMDVTKDDSGTHLVSTLFSDARMRQCLFDPNDSAAPPECKYLLIE